MSGGKPSGSGGDVPESGGVSTTDAVSPVAWGGSVGVVTSSGLQATNQNIGVLYTHPMWLLPIFACRAVDPTSSPDTDGPEDSTPDTDSGTPPPPETSDTGTPPVGPPDAVTLPGDGFFPEGIGLGADGSLVVGSIATGALAVAAPGADAAVEVLAAGGFGAAGIMGIEVEPATGLVWFCTADLRGGEVSALRAWDLTVPAEVHAFPLPAGGFCNDVTLGDDGTVYASDSDGGGIVAVPPDRSGLVPWVYDPGLYNPGSFALNGIAAAPGVVYLGRFDTGEVLAFDVAAIDGGATTWTVVATGVGAIDGLDLDGDHLVAVDGPARRLVRIDPVTGAQEVVAEGLDGPTTLEVAGDDAWVVEGQLADLVGGTPDLPFRVVRVPLR